MIKVSVRADRASDQGGRRSRRADGRPVVLVLLTASPGVGACAATRRPRPQTNSLKPGQQPTTLHLSISTYFSHVILHYMGIGGRDRRIVNHVAGFKQLPSPQVRALDFWENKSQNPCHEVLRRLVIDGYLARFRGRSVGGQQG